jgi:1,4-alpha-glucan branching enzyme
VPDPASRYQPEDVEGPSEVIDLTRWTFGDENWRGRPWVETVLYELHVGTFTREGTFRAAMEKLDHLNPLGRDSDSTHAGRRFPRPAELGL